MDEYGAMAGIKDASGSVQEELDETREIRVCDPPDEDAVFPARPTAAHVTGLIVPLVPLDEYICTGVLCGPLYATPQTPMERAVAPPPPPVTSYDASKLIALTLSCMAARVVSSTLPPEAQAALETSSPSTAFEAQSLMTLLQTKPRRRGRPKKSDSADDSDCDQSDCFDTTSTFPFYSPH